MPTPAVANVHLYFMRSLAFFTMSNVMTYAATPRMVQPDCFDARLGLSRAITTYPMPFSMAAKGSSTASAPRANTRLAR